MRCWPIPCTHLDTDQLKVCVQLWLLCADTSLDGVLFYSLSLAVLAISRVEPNPPPLSNDHDWLLHRAMLRFLGYIVQYTQLHVPMDPQKTLKTHLGSSHQSFFWNNILTEVLIIYTAQCAFSMFHATHVAISWPFSQSITILHMFFPWRPFHTANMSCLINFILSSSG